MKQYIDFKSLGDELKNIESSTETRLLPNVPVYARLDGKNFSKFTRGMKKPYDDDMIYCMRKVTERLVEETNADLGYCQSDEISLYWSNPKKQNEMLFKGRHSKFMGELVGIATSVFTQLTMEFWPNKVKSCPRFDCRIFNVSEDDAGQFFLWRQMDCVKNSISLLSQSYFSHKSLNKVSTKKRLARLEQNGIFWEDQKDEFKFGIFVSKVKTMKKVDNNEIPSHIIGTIPEYIERNIIKSFCVGKLQNIDNLKLFLRSPYDYVIKK